MNITISILLLIVGATGHGAGVNTLHKCSKDAAGENQWYGGGLSQLSDRRPTKSRFVVAPQENFSAAINFQKIL
jgi:hypothetical protein